MSPGSAKCNKDKERMKCDVCRTINLAKHVKQPKPDMQITDKCAPPDQKYQCIRAETPLQPTCYKVCNKEEYNKLSRGQGPTITRMPYYSHGKLLYAIKAGILVGSVYFTYTQGVWGNQQEVTECLHRWQEYARSLSSRRPPTFDKCGNVIKKDSVESMLAPLYSMYKCAVTTCFAGVVKVPLLMKCAYFDYLKALEEKEAEEAKERKIRRK